MRRLIAVLVGAGLLGGGLLATATRAAAAPVKWPSTLQAAHTLRLGARLVSANGRYRAAVEPNERLVIRTAAGKWIWHTPRSGPDPFVYLTRTGSLELKTHDHVPWSSASAGSGRHDVLTLRNDGVLALTSGPALVWSSAIGSQCAHRRGKSFVVDLSAQFARMCSGSQQVRTTPVTTGAVSLGDGTPTGTWRVQARVRDTTLYPAAGGAYPVHYWMPYDGAYGIHDSPWQKFAYGSTRYKTQGSHGCVHVPGPTMAWLFSWAPVGTTVSIHR